MYNANFCIHDLINIKILTVKSTHLNFLQKQYNYFLVEKLKQVDIEVVIAPFDFIEAPNIVDNYTYSVKYNKIYWGVKRKFARWESLIEGIEDKHLKIYFWGNVFSLKYLCMWIIEPLINLKLTEIGHIMLHASAVNIDNNAFVACGFPGGGKSSLAMYFSNNTKANFMSDEYIIISILSVVLNFYLPVALYDYNVPNITGLRSRLSFTENIIIKIKLIIRKVTFDYLKLPTYIDFSTLSNGASVVKIGTLRKFLILNKANKNELCCEPVDIDGAVNDILKINLFQFRFINKIFNYYLSENPSSNIVGIAETQRNILCEALHDKKVVNVSLPNISTLDEKQIINLLN
jgi:hypothetical protein